MWYDFNAPVVFRAIIIDLVTFRCRFHLSWIQLGSSLEMPLCGKPRVRVLYSSNLTSFTSFPKKLYTTTFPSNASTEAEGILLDFLSKLENFLNVTATVLDYDSMWAASPQAVSTNASTLSDLLYLTYPTLISKQQYTLFGAPFIADYQAAHDGRHPFLDPNPAVRWAFAQTNQTTLEEGSTAK
jgi:hypothetical protein